MFFYCLTQIFFDDSFGHLISENISKNPPKIKGNFNEIDILEDPKFDALQIFLQMPRSDVGSCDSFGLKILWSQN